MNSETVGDDWIGQLYDDELALHVVRVRDGIGMRDTRGLRVLPGSAYVVRNYTHEVLLNTHLITITCRNHIWE